MNGITEGKQSIMVVSYAIMGSGKGRTVTLIEAVMFSEGHKPEVSTVYVSVAFAMMELDVPMIVPAALAFVHWYESAEELVKTTESPWQSVVKPLAMIVGGGVSGMMDKAMDAVALSQLLASVYVAE